MNTLEFIKNKFQLRYKQKMPIAIKISRFNGLCELFNDLNFKIGAEIGVYTGRYSTFLLANVKNLKLYCIDPWKAYSEYVEQPDDEGQKTLDECYKKAVERIKKYEKGIIIKKTSEEAVKEFEDNSLDFVFIDGNHSFEYVIYDIAQWSKKVKKEGIIAGHDYWNSFETTFNLDYKPSEKDKIKCCQVKDAVDAWTKTNHISPWFITTADKCKSWFYVKE